jgi:hypothetical protein
MTIKLILCSVVQAHRLPRQLSNFYDDVTLKLSTYLKCVCILVSSCTDLMQILSSLPAFASDLLRIQPPSALAVLIKPYLLSLQSIEQKHRKKLPPVLFALSAAVANTPSTAQLSALTDAVNASGLSEEESEILRATAYLRGHTRDLVEANGALSAKRWAEDLEKRE